jgi:hypothetical protein
MPSLSNPDDRRHGGKCLIWILRLLLMLAVAPPLASGEDRQPNGGVVVPPGVRPQGYSLEDMARLLARFSVSGNDLLYYPSRLLKNRKEIWY